MKYIVYSITSPSNKVYIGVTNDFNRRMSEHKHYWLTDKQNIALHNSFSKYGFDKHIKCILHSGLEKDEAYEMEKYLISSMNLTNSKIGLNSRDGGLGGNMIDWKSEYGQLIIKSNREKSSDKYYKKWDLMYDKIISMVNSHTHLEICDELNISHSSLSKYLKRKNISITRKKANYDDKFDEFNKLVESGTSFKESLKISGLSRGTLYRIRKLKEIDNN